jgi:hypothetical protein
MKYRSYIVVYGSLSDFVEMVVLYILSIFLHFNFDKIFVTDIVLCCIWLCNWMTISVSLVLVTYEDGWNKNKLLLLLLLLLLQY